MIRVVVLGAGAMGLAAAHRATCLGHDVTIIEASPEPGGMAAHFDLDGLSIERYYHFVCRTDEPTFELLRELGLEGRLHWRPTSMGLFAVGSLHSWGDPISLLRFPHLSLLQKLRYGVLMFVSVRRNSWPALEHVSAKDWLTRWCGEDIYKRLWQPLFELKFHEYANPISAAWLWTRIRRIGRSRRSMFQEELGYIEGGSETLVNALVEAVTARGARLRLGEPAQRVVIKGGRVTGVETPTGYYPAEAVISTVPMPNITPIVADLPPALRDRYAGMVNIGVTCVVLKLRRSVTPHFWVNTVIPDLPIPGIVEFSNLRPMPNGETVVFVPYYMPTHNPLWSRPDEVFVAESLACLRRINPAVTDADLITSNVSRLRHAQPICPPGFASRIPPVQTPIRGLQIADSSYYYPEDRGIAESVRLGEAMARAVPSAEVPTDQPKHAYA